MLHLPKLNIYPENNLEIICRNCKYKYAVVHGEVLAFYVRLEQPAGDNFRSRYRWIYELRLVTALGVKVLQFLTTSRTQSFLATVGVTKSPDKAGQPSLEGSLSPTDSRVVQGCPALSRKNLGDRVNVLYPMKRDTVLKNIMCIQNLTTEKTCVLFHRKDILFFRALAIIFPTTLAAILANLSPSGTGKLLIAGSLPLDIAAATFVVRITDFRERNKYNLARLSYEQKLLKDHYELNQRLQELRQEQKADQLMIEQLRSLRQKMIKVQTDLYTNRAATVSRGIDALEKQMELTQTLITGYAQTTNILLIEYRTSTLAQQLPGDITSQVLSKMEELKAIEAMKADLILLVNPQKLLESELNQE